MRRMYLGLTATTILISAASMPVRAAEDAEPRKAIQAGYKEYDKMALKGMSGMQKWSEQYLSPDFTLVLTDGSTMNHKQYTEMLDRMVKAPAPAWKDVKSQKTHIKRLTMTGSDAVVLVQIETTFSSNLPKKPRFEWDKTYQETWSKVGEAWKVKRSEEIEVKKPEKAVNNKPERPKAPDNRNPQNRRQTPNGMPPHP